MYSRLARKEEKRKELQERGLVTKVHYEIRDLMLDFSNVDVIKRKVQELKKILDAFNEAHGAYHNQLSEERDMLSSPMSTGRP